MGTRGKRDWSVRIGGAVYGATADRQGPIGGGSGYRRIITRGDFSPTSIDELLDALSKAKAGQVIFLRGGLKFDLTERAYIDKLVLELPGGVTLASDRGVGRSKGAILFNDALVTQAMIKIMGDGARITGLRLRGPDPERRMEHHERCIVFGKAKSLPFDHEYYYKFPVNEGVLCNHSNLEVDNCEISAFSHTAIYLRRGSGHRVHHSFIHHNQYNGLGYGVTFDISDAVVDHNLFNYNRHSIAATGRPGSGYEAHDNVELGVSLSHCFDMHGGADREDGTQIAGDWMKVHRNTFLPRAARAVVVRGVPTKEAEIHHNWFAQKSPTETVIGFEKIRTWQNACGTVRTKVFK